MHMPSLYKAKIEKLKMIFFNKNLRIKNLYNKFTIPNKRLYYKLLFKIYVACFFFNIKQQKCF